MRSSPTLVLFVVKGSDFKSGDIRLVGGPLSWEGRVEIYLDGEWGTISNDQAEDEDAHVACRQLGYDIRCESAENEDFMFSRIP